MLLTNKIDENIFFKLNEFANVIANKEGHIIGIDLSYTMIGLATTDNDRMIASPVLSIKRLRNIADFEKIESGLINVDSLLGAVIGLPLSLNSSIVDEKKTNTIQFAQNLIRYFINKYNKYIYCLLYDERLTTRMSINSMKKMNVKLSKRAMQEDKLAAFHILNHTLEIMRHNKK